MSFTSAPSKESFEGEQVVMYSSWGRTGVTKIPTVLLLPPPGPALTVEGDAADNHQDRRGHRRRHNQPDALSRQLGANCSAPTAHGGEWRTRTYNDNSTTSKLTVQRIQVVVAGADENGVVEDGRGAKYIILLNPKCMQCYEGIKVHW